ncbi:CD209 antigen-like protein D isoform X1 [Sinocyclocheilus anshuiensis]|uniref:CD209 antigen-like protein D isoform X1 n=1 Tax=Sinocyclocheilus anshuiensis TaxID=1608454 RepID=UPI0007B8F38D|nr:PREDICTED: CD209 antigen-like protein D isoform X1 [Sinocyclocheilus anshuiensis]
MESKKEVEVELEEITTVEEDKEKEDPKKETKAEKVEEGNIYSTLTSPSEHEYGVPSSTCSYTVNNDTSLDIRRKLRVYRIVSLVLFVICVLLLIVVLVLFMKLTGTPPCQEVEQTTRSLSEQKCSLERCQELYQLPQRLCSDCGKGWLRFENTCYFLSQNRLTWQQSREECQRKGGDLAVITNERVQMYLSMKGNLHYWIGLSHLGTNEWTWINNAVLTARYWGDVSFPGQCAILAGNEPPERSWRPYSCNLYLQYICQKM